MKKPTNAELLTRAVKAEEMLKFVTENSDARMRAIAAILWPKSNDSGRDFMSARPTRIPGWMEIAAKIGELKAESRESSLGAALNAESERAEKAETKLRQLIQAIHRRDPRAGCPLGGCPDC